MTPPPPTSTLFPYTTLFRSLPEDLAVGLARDACRRPVGRLGRRQRRRGGSVALAAGPVAGHAVLLGELLRVGEQLGIRSEEHTSELQSLRHLVCRLLLEKKK